MKRLIPFVLVLSTSAFAADSAPTAVTIGNGTAKFSALLQSWAYNDTTALVTKFNFRMRRMELKFAGNLNESVRWFLMADPAKNLSTTGDNKILQDLGVAYAITPELELIVGQMKVPSTAEGLESAGELLFPERTKLSRQYGDRRDPGAMLAWKESIWRLNAMISNGQGPNIDDTNNAKELSVRAEVLPTEATKFGLFTTAGDYNYGMKSRYGASAKVTMGALLLKGEGVIARDNGIGAHGWAVDTAYLIEDRFQPAFRWESLDIAGVNSHAATLGFNYYNQKHNAKIQLANVWLRDMSGANGTYTTARGTSGSLFIACFQAAL